MLIAVTGATGFVGGHVVEQLANAGHDVVAYGRRVAPASLTDRCSSYQTWDIITGPIEVPHNVQAVVHCAAKVEDWGPLAGFYAANVAGTRAVLETFPRSARFVYVSSASVYDLFVAGRPLREDAPVPRRPLNFYAHTKLLGERAVQTSGRSAVILRPHAIYGPNDTTLLPRLLSACRFGRLLAVGTGRNRISLTHVRNLARAVLCAIEADAPSPGSEVFNIADADTRTVDGVLRPLIQALDLPPRVLYLPTGFAWALATQLERAFRLTRTRRSPVLTRYIVAQMALDSSLDITKARAQLGYAPVDTYQSSLPETVASYLSRHP